MEQLALLRAIADSGGGWVIWLLVVSSFLSVGVIVERLLVLKRQARYQASVLPAIEDQLGRREPDEVLRRLKAGSVLSEVGRDLEARAPNGREAMLESLESQLALQRRRLEKRLLILGTLGNNAPFIGLLGTVLGVIHAFQDLSVSGGHGSAAVMAGLAEALVATAVGILVALPCVAAYNYVEKGIDDVIEDARRFGKRLAWALGEEH
ncbi:MAG: MotA/TolQ/ExbB proton channel family protein [Elusimicrobia bacterium]|nr:MotA/TolQ/ExbB proton channel family protein [Elusimicrobiota bacterium]